MKKYSNIILFLLAVILAEVFIFNITSFRLLFGNYERIEYSKADLEKYKIDDYTYEIKDINKEVGTVKFEVSDDIPSFNYSWSYSDATSEYFMELPLKYYVAGEERTQYMPVYLSGETNSLKFKYSEINNIEIIVINENIPIKFNFMRVG